MKPFQSFVFPEIPPELRDKLFDNEKLMVVVGVLGKSTEPHCNKLINFDLLHTHPALDDETGTDGRVKFFFRTEGNTMFLHFDATFDNFVLLQLAERMVAERGVENPAHFIEFNSAMRTRFARVLLFALQVCHILVLVEPSVSFDMSYLSIFKSLKIIREKYVLKFLPKMLKNANVGSFMGKECRLCSPRLIFMFNLPDSGDPQAPDDIETLETNVEDYINKTFRNEFIISHNSALSLFSVSKNRQFVYYNDLTAHQQDPLMDSIEMLSSYLAKQQQTSTGTLPEKDELEVLEQSKPYDFFGFPRKHNFELNMDELDEEIERSILSLVDDHVTDALETGFDESNISGRQKSKIHFALPSTYEWFEMFKYMYELFIENPNVPFYDAYDPDYKAYLENFHEIVDIDERFFGEICEQGVELAMIKYKEKLPPHYSFSFHETKYEEAQALLVEYARGPELKASIDQLKEYCDSIWQSGKQQCEYPSLRANPCVLRKHKASDPSAHSSGVIYVSSCNCGRTQGHRDDPYTIRQANYEFYQTIAKSCSNCNRLERVQFPIFEPSISDFRAAEFINKNFSNLMSFDSTGRTASDLGPHSRATHGNSLFLSGSQKSQNSSASLSFNIGSDGAEEELEDNVGQNIDDRRGGPERDTSVERKDESDEDDEDDDDEQVVRISARMKEIVIKVGRPEKSTGTPSNETAQSAALARQPSTTEYLPGMLHAASPPGLLPRFPSWSLVCLGSSSIYTHNTGLPEHVQSGFLSGSNFLLPWDVSVRLEHAQSWAASYEKIRNRKKGNQHSSKSFEQNNTFTLKIFVGVEYECLRGHRFIMNAPDSILRSGSEIARDSGSKVVFNDMPIYFPCPCRNTINNTAQLMRVHIITPKAPVNVIVDPKVKIFQNSMQSSVTFTSGMAATIKLTQSSYWMLRLPFVYEGDTGPLMAPTNVNPSSAITHGVLMAGMYGIRENELNEETVG